jgi:uncharacterized protein YuzE
MATLKQREQRRVIAGALALAERVGRLPASNFWVDYDEEADVLYISLQRPQKATDTVEVNDGEVLLDYRRKVLVGITVLDASQR